MARIKILFDAHPLIGQMTGVGYYTSHIITELAKRHPEDIELIGYYHNFLLRKPRILEPVAANIRYRPIAFVPGQIVNALRRIGINLPIELLTFLRADFLLFTNYLGLSSLSKTPYAPVVHDLTFIDHPESMSDKNRKDLARFVPKMTRKASFIVTVSEFSKSRILEKLPTSSPVIVTHIPPAVPLKLDRDTIDEVLKKHDLPLRFLLALGTLEPRKNITNLLDAYILLPAEIRQKTPLVIAGKIDWKYDEIMSKIKSLQSSGHDIRYLGYIDNTARAALYSAASLFVMPSIYEGFGMPILEAFSYGTHCAVSDIPVFHEVAGSAAAYFDPFDPESIARTLESELSGSKTTDSQIQSQLQRFDWASVVEPLYQQIVASTDNTKDRIKP